MGDQFSLSVTGYAGHEEEILQMRNRNRRNPRSRQYLDWRYLGQPSPTPPMVFWMRDTSGEVVAMASLIFRPYIVNNEKRFFGVLGDISVNEEHRGEGLSKKLFEFMNSHIEKNKLSIAFVMPNRAAEKALASTGWLTVGNLVPRVCVTEPVEKFKTIFKVGLVAGLASITLNWLTHFTIARQIRKGFSLKVVKEFDHEFETFWDNFPKRGFVMHDRSVDSLAWRYCKQPETDFSIAKFYDGNKMVGYIVSTTFPENGMCLVSDFLVAEPQLVKPCMALFIKEALENKKIITVRIVLIEHDEYARQLWKLSFFPRDPVTVFQIFHACDSSMGDPKTWFITPGDKDA